MDPYSYTFGTETTVPDGSGGTTTYQRGDKFETLDPCAMLDFMARVRQADPDRAVGEATQGALDNLRRDAERSGCLNEGATAPAATTRGGGTATPPADGDTPETQGAPRSVEPPSEVSANRGPGYDPSTGETPTNALNDPRSPASPAEVGEGLVNAGESPERASERVQRAERGDNGEGEERSTHTGERAQAGTQDGDPVHLFSGLLSLRSIDLEVQSPFLSMQLVRRYLSGRPYYGPLGYNWDHNWNVYLRELNSGDVARWSGELHEDIFRFDGSGFQPPPGIFEVLERDTTPGTGYTVRTRGAGTLRFERPAGWTDAERIPLVQLRDRAGNWIALSYDTDNRLQRVVDGDGRFLEFHYGSCGFLERVLDHAGRQVRYYHDQMAEHLVAVALPSTDDQPDGATTKYEYVTHADHFALRHNILYVTDHEENTVLVNEYGEDPSQPSFNRIVAQYVGGYLFTFAYTQIQYVPENILFVNDAAWQTVVRHPDGSSWTYTFNYRGDLIDERLRLLADRSFRIVATQREYDEQGSLARLTRPDGSMTEWTRDVASPDPRARGNLLQVELRAGPLAPIPSRIVFRATYDPAFQMVRRVRYESAVEAELRYDFDLTPGAPTNRGDLMEIAWPDATLPDGTIQSATTRLEWNARGQVQAAVSPTGVRRELVYEPAGNVLAGFQRELHDDVTGAHLVVSTTYDVFGYVATRTVPGGHVYAYRYDAMGRLKEHRLPAVNGVVDSFSYRYDGSSRVVEVSRPRGAYADAVITGAWIVDRYELTPLGHLQSLTIGANSASPRVWRMQNDWAGRPYRIEDPMGVITTRCWDERGLMLDETRAAGTAEELTYRWFYDELGHNFRREEPGDLISRQAFDPWGRLREVTYPNGSRGINRWGFFDMLVEQELIGDPGDGSPPRTLRKSTYGYDERGRVVSHTEAVFSGDPALATPLTMHKWHDADGRVTRRVSPQGGVSWVRQDGLGRLTGTEDALGNARQLSYGPDGLVSSITETDVGPFGSRARQSFFESDARGRLARVVHPSGAVYRNEYDGRDLITSSIDALGMETRRRYGLLGEREQLLFDPAIMALAYTHAFDPLGRELSFTDPTGETTTVGRDVHGRITSVSLADGTTITRAFNAAGKLASETTPDGSTVSYGYDTAQRLSGFTVAAGSGRAPVAPHVLRYDGANRVIGATQGPVSGVRRFDSLDRVWREELDGRVFERTFDDLASRIIFRYPDGREELQRFDALGRVDRITLRAAGSSPLGANGGAPGDLIFEAQFLGTHRIATLAHGNGVSSQWRHDDDGRLNRVEHERGGASLDSARYLHELYNRRRVKQLLAAPQENNLYTYDRRGRLTEQRSGFPLAALPDTAGQPGQTGAIATAEAAAASASSIVQWGVDGSDVRTSETRTVSGSTNTVAYTQAPGHRIVSVGSAALTYDADGRRTSDAQRRYIYDGLGRIVRVQDAAGTSTLATFQYDPFGRWAGGTLGSTSQRRFCFENECRHEEDGGSTVLRQHAFIPGGLTPLATVTASGVLHLHYDGSHSIVLATDRTGAPVERYRYAAFGAPAIYDGAGTSSRPSSAIGLTPIFGGMPFQQGLGLYQTIARPYDPSTGLFLARDPLLHVQSPSPYVYALHDPVNGIDPDGNIAPLLAAGLIVGGIGALVGAGAVIFGSDDYDLGDVVAGAFIGFGAGFIGAVSFGWAAGAIGGGLLSAAGGSAVVAQSAWMGTAISVTSGVGAGAFSGLASGLFSGAANGVYHGGIRGRGDMWQMIGDGMYREGISGMAAGAVGGGLFQGALLAGRPGVAWNALRSSFAGGNPARVIGRGLLSPYGLGGAGIGFTSGMTGGIVGNMLDGDDFDVAISDSWGQGLFSAGAGAFTSLAHPTMYQFWRARLSPSHASAIESTRPGGIHHQRSVAQYPEYAVRTDAPRAPHTFLDRLNNLVTRGNIQGPQSTYDAPNNPLSHVQMHEQWRFGQAFAPNNWSNVPTHGPWTPPWTPNLSWPNALGQAHSDKEQ